MVMMIGSRAESESPDSLLSSSVNISDTARSPLEPEPNVVIAPQVTAEVANALTRLFAGEARLRDGGEALAGFINARLKLAEMEELERRKLLEEP